MVSIIVLAYNQLSYTKACLKSLLEYTSPIKTPYELIVVDNASTDGTKEYLQGLEQTGQIKCIYNKENKGFPAANNQGAAIAEGEYLCLLNNDTLLTKDWLEHLLRCIKSDPLLAAVGPYTSHSSGYQQVYPQPPYRGEEELQKYADKFSQEEKYVDFLVFFCCLIKRKVWDELGGLDEDFGRGNFEDNLFCYRLLEKGYKMKVCGNAFVHHYAGTTFQTKDPVKLKEYSSLLAHNQKIFLKKINRYERVSLIMIVSDQEKPETLKKCLDSIYEWVDEICIVFNYKNFKNPWKFKRLNSVLQNLPVAESCVNYYKWTDFSDMRNKALSMATGRYIFWIDTDDTCQTPAALRDLILKNPHIDCFKCKVLSYTEIKTVETIIHNRLFRRVKSGQSPYWVNRCHEDISYSMNKLGYTHAITDLTIQHFGYLNAKSWLKKNERNLKLMEQDIVEIKNQGEADEGRLSMIYYGVVNAYIILAGSMKPRPRQKLLIKALEITDECIKLLKNEDPLMAKMWMLRGTICLDAGQTLAAKQSYHKAYDEWKQVEAGINLSHLYLGERNWNKAIEILEEINNKHKGAYPFGNLSQDPVHIHSMLMEKLGHAYANKAQECKDNPEAFDEYMRKAENYYKECLNIRPKLEVVNVLAQIFSNTNRIDESAHLIIKAVNRWPGYWVGWYRLGDYEMINNRKYTAKLFYQEALRLKPGHKESLHNLRMIDNESRRVK